MKPDVLAAMKKLIDVNVEITSSMGAFLTHIKRGDRVVKDLSMVNLEIAKAFTLSPYIPPDQKEAIGEHAEKIVALNEEFREYFEDSKSDVQRIGEAVSALMNAQDKLVQCIFPDIPKESVDVDTDK